MPGQDSRGSARPDAARPAVVYVAGTAHSGSTLLDLVIGSHPEVQSLGELKVLVPGRRAKVERILDGACPCGAPSKRECGFWSGVDERLRDEVPGGLLGLDVDAPDAERFVAHNAALFRATAEVGARPWLVDSSKSPRRLRRLLGSGVFHLAPVLLVRSAHGVVHSELAKGRGLVHAALRHRHTRAELDRTLRGREHLAVRYERFAADPASETRRLMQGLGLSYDASQLDWARRPHHLLCGNRIRHARESRIALDDRWREALSPTRKAAISALTWRRRDPVQPSSTSR